MYTVLKTTILLFMHGVMSSLCCSARMSNCVPTSTHSNAFLSRFLNTQLLRCTHSHANSNCTRIRMPRKTPIMNLQMVVFPSHKTLKHQLLENHLESVVLYGPSKLIEKHELSLEHVVPFSVLKSSVNPVATKDPLNIFLSYGPVNNLRGNFRISFAHLDTNKMELEKKMKKSGVENTNSLEHVGYGNCIERNQGIFYPRSFDLPLIAATIVAMHDKWFFKLGDVTVEEYQTLKAIAQLKCSCSSGFKMFETHRMARHNRCNSCGKLRPM